MDIEAKFRFNRYINSDVYDEVMEEPGFKPPVESTPNWILIVRLLEFLLGLIIGYWAFIKRASPRPSAAEIRKGAYWRSKDEEKPPVDCEGELSVARSHQLRERCVSSEALSTSYYSSPVGTRQSVVSVFSYAVTYACDSPIGNGSRIEYKQQHQQRLRSHTI